MKRILIVLFAMMAAIAQNPQSPIWPLTDAATGVYTNRIVGANVTLNGSISPGATSMVLTPSGNTILAPSWILIDSEIFHCTNWNAGTNTMSGCTPGAESTSQVTHSNGAIVHLPVTAQSLNQILANIKNALADPGGNGIVKRTSANVTAAAVSGTDYAPPTSGSVPLKGNGAGGTASAVAADMVGLFGSSGAGKKYLGDDGTLHTVYETVVSVCFSGCANTSPYTVGANDTYISCDATAGAVVINLPAAAGTGRKISVKKTDSSTNACTPTHAGSDTIDGAASYSLTAQYAASAVVDTATGVWQRAHINQLSGTVTGPSSNTSLANSGVTAGTYGDSTHTTQIVVGADGRLTSVTNVSITGGGGGASAVNQMTDFSCARTSTTVATCTFPTGSTNMRSNSYVQPFSTSVVGTITTVPSATTFYIYWDPNAAAIKVDTSGTSFTTGGYSVAFTGATVTNTSATGYPADVVPLARLTAGATVNTWDTWTSCLPSNTTGCVDDRSMFNITVTKADSSKYMIDSIDSHGIRKIGVDTSSNIMLRSCTIDNDTQSATPLVAAQFSGGCEVSSAATIVEVDVWGGTGVIGGTVTTTGTSSVNLQRYTPNGGATATILSGNLASVAGVACALTSTAGTCLNGLTSSGTITVSTTSLSTGDFIRVSAASPDTVQTWYRTVVKYRIN